jgi:phosphoribosylformimino-5-aminoimidazole carboxamide ribotide isomerase
MIFPAIDLMDGGCVRLTKGDFSRRTNYATDPVAMAVEFARTGAKWLHLVDLDGAKNQQAAQSELVIEIANSCGLQTQTGGGLRSKAQIKNLLDNGLTRVVIGSLAVSQPKQVMEWMETFGPDKIVMALDVELDQMGVPRPAVHGWTQSSELSLWEVIEEYSNIGLQTILVTDIAKDGVLRGANIALYAQIMKRYPTLDLITSGGVGTIEDVRALKALNPAGIIIGKALYENRFTLTEVIKC